MHHSNNTNVSLASWPFYHGVISALNLLKRCLLICPALLNKVLTLCLLLSVRWWGGRAKCAAHLQAAGGTSVWLAEQEHRSPQASQPWAGLCTSTEVGEDAHCSPTASFKERIVPSVVVRKITTPEGTKRQQCLVTLRMCADAKGCFVSGFCLYVMWNSLSSVTPSLNSFYWSWANLIEISV